MDAAKREKLIVLVVSFAFFAGGVLALSMDRGNGRTIALAGCFAALIAIAVRQTVRRTKKEKK